MSYERFIGLRYLMAKKRTQVVSIITLISIGGVALGVTALIVVLSVMGGFKADLQNKILGTKAHVVVQDAKDGDIVEADEIAQRVMQVDGVTGAEPYIEAELMISSPTNLSGVVLRGVDPDRVGQVSDLPEAIDKGKGELSYLEDPAPLLDELAEDRDRDIDEILDRIDKERDDYEDEKDKVGGDEKGSRQLPEPETGQAESAEDGSSAGDDQAGMPPIIGEEDQKEQEDAEDEEDSGMPPIFGDGEDAGDDKPDDELPGGSLPGILIGPELARSLQVDLGDEVNIVTPDGEMGPTGMMPRSRPFRVVGVFRTGMYEYDANYAYTTFSDAAAFLNREGATGVEIKTVDPEEAIAIGDLLREELGAAFEVLDWQEMNRSLFFALELEKIAMFVVLTFIILVASFSIVAMLIMIVIEKARDIAILKSMGVSDGGIRRIFQFQGLVIGALGAFIGLLLGLGICTYLRVYGVPLDSEVYYISTLPVDVNTWEVVAVIVCALLISWVATVYPAYLASKLKPVDGLRYD
ncbi:MAG: FtsX-like permease family protein [Persicimonas sp.]